MKVLQITRDIPRVSFAEFQKELKASWKQGEHFSIVAPTYGGKSTIAVRGLLPLWPYSITFDAKGEDEVLQASGKTITKFPSAYHFAFNKDKLKKLHLIPNPPRLNQKQYFKEAFHKVWKQKQWAVYIDELRLFSDLRQFNLTEPEEIWLYGRSRGITLIAGTQAPRYVPSAFFEQAKHFLIGRTQRKGALQRLGEIAVGDTDMIERTVPFLDDYEFLYVGRSGMVITKYPLGRGQ